MSIPATGAGPTGAAAALPARVSLSWARGLLSLCEVGAMWAGLGLALAGAAEAYRASLVDPRPLPGVRLEGQDVGGLAGAALDEAVAAAERAGADRAITLSAGAWTGTRTARELGARGAPEASKAAAWAVGRSGDPVSDLLARRRAQAGRVDVPVVQRFDEEAALAALTELAPAVERPSLPTRLDLAARRVLPPQAGAALLVAESLSPVAVGLATGAHEIGLVTVDKPPAPDPDAERLAGLDVSVVLGTFETPYQNDAAHRDRVHNLEIGAAAVDGTVVYPGETFSFNQVVGARTAENGFRYAPGITAGELVDVLGGGICQVSTTLYGAVFFAGLQIERARPHSRPSSYVDMGLDSTVVYPDVDMRWRNDLDFPVAVHMTVREGKVRAQVLGARRPYRVVFERKLLETIPFDSRTRDDASLRLGAQAVAQRGMRGFRIERTRRIFRGDEVVREETRTLVYPPTTEILRRGTNPAGVLPKPRSLPPLKEPTRDLRIEQ